MPRATRRDSGAMPQMVAGRLREGLGVLEGVEMLDLGREQSAIVSFRLPHRDIRAVLARAQAEAVTIGASPPGSTRLDAQARHLGYILRASPHYFNTQSEIDRLIDLIAACSAG